MSKLVIAYIGIGLLGCNCAALGANQVSPAWSSSEAVRNIVVIVDWDKATNKNTLGSGVMFPDGSVITDCHILKNVRHYGVQQGDSRSQAILEHEDQDRDLCKLNVARPERFDPFTIRLRLVREVLVGEPVYAVGVPTGGMVTVIRGQVVKIQRFGEDKVIWISSRLVAGYSGGALFDRSGSLIGITTYRVSSGKKLCYAYPAEYALPEKVTNVDHLERTVVAGSLQSRLASRPAVDYKGVADAYLYSIAEVSRNNITYPEEARQQRWTGISSISFRFDLGGELGESYVNVSSGYAALDVTALLAVRKAISALPPPELVKEKGLTGTVTIPFTLPKEEQATRDADTSGRMSLH